MTEANYCAIAKQWGYEWVLGDPWTHVKALACVDVGGVKIAFNNNANRATKRRLRMNNLEKHKRQQSHRFAKKLFRGIQKLRLPLRQGEN